MFVIKKWKSLSFMADVMEFSGDWACDKGVLVKRLLKVFKVFWLVSVSWLIIED